MDDEPLIGEVGRLHGMVLVDEQGEPLKPPDPMVCPGCGERARQFEFAYYYGTGATRYACPGDHVWLS